MCVINGSLCAATCIFIVRAIVADFRCPPRVWMIAEVWPALWFGGRPLKRGRERGPWIGRHGDRVCWYRQSWVGPCGSLGRPWLLPYSLVLTVRRLADRVLLMLSVQCESKKIPPRGPDIFSFFHKRLRICNRFFTHLLIVLIFARLQIFIQLSPILTKLCHIKCDYPVHIICAKCPKRAITRAFRRLRKSLIALLIVVCGKSLKNKHFYNVTKHVGYD